MAPKIEATITGKDETKAAFDSAQHHAETFGEKLKETLNKPFELLKGLFAIEMVKIVGEFVKGSVEAAAESQAAWARVSAAVNNTGVSFRNVQGDLKETFAKVAEGTRFSEMQVSDAFATVLNVTNDYSGSLKNLTLIQNLAIAKQIDLNTAATIVGKAMEGQTTLLKRYGIIIKDGADAIEELNKRMKGFAEEDGKSLQGRLAMISKEWEELKIALGEAITGSNTAADSAGKLVNALKGFTDWIEHNRGNIHGFIDDIGHMAGAIVDAKNLITDPRGPIGFLLQKNTQMREARNTPDGDDDPGGDAAYYAALAKIRKRHHAEAEEQIAANAGVVAADKAERDAKKREEEDKKHFAAMKEELTMLVEGRDMIGLTAENYERLGQIQYALEQKLKDVNLPLKERLAIQKDLQKITDADHKRAEETLRNLEKIAELEKKGVSLSSIRGPGRVEQIDSADQRAAKGLGPLTLHPTASALPTSGAGSAPNDDDAGSFSRELRAGTNEANTSLKTVDSSIDSLGRTLGRVRGTAVKDFFTDWQQGIADVVTGHEHLGNAIVKSARKAIGGAMAAEGQATMLKAAAAAAEGWFNPAKLLQASQLFGVGTAELALAAALGGGGGGSSAGSGSGISPSGFSQSQGQATQGKTTVILKGNGLNFTNPDDLNALRDALQSLSGTRDLEFLFLGNT